MSCGAALLVLLCTTGLATAYAVYCEIRMARMAFKVLQSDAIATERANEIQHLQMRIEMTKRRIR